MTGIDDLILGLMKIAPPTEKLTTYEIAKRLKISWSTANLYCYKMKSFGIIKGEEIKAEIGEGKKMMWWC